MERHEWDERLSGDGLLFPAGPSVVVVEAVEGRPPGRALDLGAGEGRHAVWLASLGWRVTAVDWSAVGLAKGRRWAETEGVASLVDWVEADLADFGPEPASYDLVLASFCHLGAVGRDDVQPRAAAALAPGGLFMVLGYDVSNLTEGSGGPDHCLSGGSARRAGGPRSAAYLLTPEGVAADLAGLGLEVTRAERQRRTVDGPDGPRPVVNVVVTALRPPT